MDWAKLADDKTVENTAKALGERGIEVIIVNNGKEAKEKVLELIPKGAEVMDVTSTTLDQIGLSKEIQESGRYKSVRKKIMSVDQKEMRHAMRRMSVAIDYVVGSVHAVTEEGQVVIASNSGSQLAPYVFGAANVIWVVGTQKIVKNLDDAFMRIKEHCFPLEDERMKKTYGMGSGISKILIFEKEVMPNRIKLIFVKENLGF